MNFLFVTQESGKVPSGVVTVLAELCRGWPESDRITVLMDQVHWAESYLLHELKEKINIQLQRTPLLCDNEWLRSLLSPLSRRFRIMVRLVLMPFSLAPYIIWREKVPNLIV